MASKLCNVAKFIKREFKIPTRTNTRTNASPRT